MLESKNPQNILKADCGVLLGRNKSATDPIYFVSFFFSVKMKKRSIKVTPASGDSPEEAVIMESYTARSSRERLRAWETGVDNDYT